MADEKKFVKGDRTRIVSTPVDCVKLRADGWAEVETFPPPPLSGAGSSNAAWQEWASAEHVDVSPDASRTEIIEAAGLTEPDAE